MIKQFAETMHVRLWFRQSETWHWRLQYRALWQPEHLETPGLSHPSREHWSVVMAVNGEEVS